MLGLLTESAENAKKEPATFCDAPFRKVSAAQSGLCSLWQAMQFTASL